MINEMITESKEKLQIQLQHVSETLQSSTHSTTAEELVLVKQQVHALHQQLEKQNHLLLDYQKKEEELKTEVTLLQEKIKEQDKKLENNNIQELEKQAIIEDLQETIKEEGNKSAALQNELETADKLVGDLKEQLREKDQETQSLKLELANCKEKEKHYILEIEEFKGRVEELQKKDYKDNHTDTGKEQSTERETRRKVDHLQVELDEMYGREIMHMKEQLIRQNKSKMEDLKSRHEGEMETILASYACTTLGMCNMYREYKEQLDLLNVIINGQDVKLQDTLSQKENLSKELCLVKREKDVLESQFNDLLEEYNVLRYQTITDHNKISQQESKLNDTYHSLHIVKAEIATMSDFLKEVECKHEKEITKYKIKLEMLEKEKNEIVKEMSESQEAQMQLLQLSHEEDLYKLKEDLEAEHQINVEKLKENLALHHKHQIEELENEMCKKIEILQCEKDNFLSEDKEPIQVLIGRLQKALSEECCSVSKSMQAFLDETYCPLNCEMNIEEKENSFVYHAISRVNLQDYRYQVEEFQDAIQNLLSKVTDEHNKFVILQMQLSKVCEVENMVFAFILLSALLLVKKF
ncbi:A-kinase anchor protein 9-like isoform X2 [Mesocricetus auratus]|nr:A-kinase anchor protein 9-like isoform X2 [Mesocricetus auratus]